MKRRLVVGLFVVALPLSLALGWLWLRLRPPSLAVPARGLTLAGVTIVNPGRDRQPARTLTIVGSKITAIAESESPAAGQFAGMYALPGLIDMHVHHPPATPLGDVELFGLLFLAHGVTSVRDTGSFDETILDTRRQIRDGQFPGPRIFACGPILDGDPPFWPGSRIVRSPGDARIAVDELAAARVDCVKVYENVAPEVLAAVRDAARRHRLPVIGHVPSRSTFSDARLADVQHLTGVVEKGSPLTRAQLRSIVTTSAALGIAHTPTLVFLERASALTDYRTSIDQPAAASLPRYYREILWNPRHDARLRGLSPSDFEDLRETLRNAKALVRDLHEAGVRIHVGTDTMNPFIVPGASLHEEMSELLDAGLTPAEVWTAATRDAGASLRMPLLGTIAVGAPADVLVFRDDPTSDLDALSTLEAVVADGRLYPRDELDRALARWREHMQDPVYDAVTMRAAAWLVPASSR